MNSSLAIERPFDLNTPWPSLLALSQADQHRKTRDEDGIFRRDVCAQAFGAGWSTSTCTPGNTLCCINANSNFPQCEQFSGSGWCCVAYQQGCYIDLSDTSCSRPGSVSCTQLSPGTTEACCLPNTTCAPGYNASATYARCNIQQQVLQALASPSSSSSISSAVQSSTSSAPPTTSTTSITSVIAYSSTSTAYSLAPVSVSTSNLGSSTTTPAQAGNLASTSLSAGAIAGIAIGPVIAVLLILLAAFLVWRSRLRKQQFESSNREPPYQSSWSQEVYNKSELGYYASAEGYKERTEAELAAVMMSPRELQAHCTKGTSFKHIDPVELEASSAYR
ncbi:hypothetical protein AMS68_005161 [Peltaster fructicola]|uniref:Mid2 domain-containing protein n=1 Tax=Peltaster fructicola TaxID=286661 RepID=A0A6H0XY34_9PEZI|nr:hypothetical protein AMS68_005161 [Peltaster fructicola]